MKFTLRRLFVHITVIAILLGAVTGFCRLTGLPDLAYIMQVSFITDGVPHPFPQPMPQNVVQALTLAAAALLCAAVIGLVLVLTGCILQGVLWILLEVWFRAMEWSAPPKQIKPQVAKIMTQAEVAQAVKDLRKALENYRRQLDVVSDAIEQCQKLSLTNRRQ